MPKVNCSVIGCSNNTYEINKWKKETCTGNNPEAKVNRKKKADCLECKPPFNLHIFPDPIKYKEPEEAWIKALRQKPFDEKGPWQPAASGLFFFFFFSIYYL